MRACTIHRHSGYASRLLALVGKVAVVLRTYTARCVLIVSKRVYAKRAIIRAYSIWMGVLRGKASTIDTYLQTASSYCNLSGRFDWLLYDGELSPFLFLVACLCSGPLRAENACLEGEFSKQVEDAVAVAILYPHMIVYSLHKNSPHAIVHELLDRL
ncbi:unnamed protein product [Ectocarpus sp. 8 AP-2014]